MYLYYYSYRRVINPLTMTPSSILAKFPWLVAATIYPILCAHWLTPYQCLDRLTGSRPALAQALHLVTRVVPQLPGRYIIMESLVLYGKTDLHIFGVNTFSEGNIDNIPYLIGPIYIFRVSLFL